MSLFFRFVAAWFHLRWAKFRGYRVMATPNEQEERLFKCYSCPELEDGTCKLCGCIIFAKVMLTTEQCPKRLWLRVKSPAVTVK